MKKKKLGLIELSRFFAAAHVCARTHTCTHVQSHKNIKGRNKQTYSYIMILIESSSVTQEISTTKYGIDHDLARTVSILAGNELGLIFICNEQEIKANNKACS